jgi:mannose-6-phosphate isomerase-like protein (cupin superfamily)
MTEINRRQFSLGLLAAASLAAENPRDLVWSPETIVWQRHDKDGTKYAVLDGSRDTPGQPFTYAFWMPGNVWVKAHHHTQQAHVAVVRGTITLGFGKKLDKSNTVKLRAGQFFIVRAGEPHFEGSDGECLIIGTALGGWKTTEIE